MRSSDRNGAEICAYILCAGKGERTGLPYNKVLHRIGLKTVVETVLDVFSKVGISRTVLVVPTGETEVFSQLASPYRDVFIVEGGATRAESVLNGLKAFPCDIAVIHDGARPFVTAELIEDSIASALSFGSGVCAVPSVDTVKRVTPDGKVSSLPRAQLYNMQTPQTFSYAEILEAYERVGLDVTDDAEAYERAGYAPKLIAGDYANIKITTASDLLRSLPANCRIGVGFDVHRLVEGRKLILGGAVIPFEKGLLGHSDADVLTHAVMDALLSAAGLPDIGVLFPDTDPSLSGASSIALLQEVLEKVMDAGYRIANVSAVVAAQRPKLAPHIPEIRASLARALSVEADRVNVSATTTEKLGLIGEGAAISCDASCLLYK